MAVYIVIGVIDGKGETVLKIFRTLNDAMIYKGHCIKMRNLKDENFQYNKFMIKVRHL